MSLRLTYDRKTANAWRKDTAKGGAAAIANTLALTPIRTCPGATPACIKVCYAEAQGKRYKALRAKTDANSKLLEECRSVEAMVKLLDEALRAFKAECNKWEAKHNVVVERIFRWHSDGDVFSAPYAKAIAKAMRLHPDVQGWMYTRSFTFVKHLVGIDNLSVYLSVDVDNDTAAKHVLSTLPEGAVKVAVMHKDKSAALAMHEVLTGKRAPVCPAISGKLPLIDERGGACKTCSLCVYGRNGVLFPIHR